MSAAQFLRYLLLPATSATVLVFIAFESIGFTLAARGGLLGWPAAVLLFSWLVKYAFVLLEAIANGAREVPVLSVEMLNPLNESRPLFQLVVLLIVGSFLGVIAWFVSTSAAAVLGVLVFFALPASTAALAVGNSIWQSIHPAVLWHLARTIGWQYFALVAVVIGYGALGAWLALHDLLPLLAVCAVGAFALLSIFTVIGGSIYEHREMLGHEPTDSPERRAAREQFEIDRERRRFLDRMHGQARGGNLAGAWESIERELAAQHHSFECYDWLLEELKEREDARLARRLAQDYLAKTLNLDNARATSIAQRILRADPGFRPRSGAQCLRLADLLRLSGDRKSAHSILSDFASQYPGDPAIPDAESLLGSLKR